MIEFRPLQESTIMSKPRILVTTAVGKTGMPVALQLLSEGFSVTAFVRKEDTRSELLKSKGADIVVGSITDINDMRKAMEGAQRAYFCTPFVEGNLKATAIFTTVAAEQKLESVVAMSQWLSNPNHPSMHTREVWLGDKLLEFLPETNVTFINPGFFVDNEMQVLPFIVQFGLMTLPYGTGLNAPASNEDMGRVAAEILARPEGHVGKTYRPTGPKLMSPEDSATVFSKVLGYKVRYINVPIWMFSKVMKGMGFSGYFIAQFQQYVRDQQKNAFGINAPNDVVRTITNREPEDYETIATRYLANAAGTKRSLGMQTRLILMLLIWMVLPGPHTSPYLASSDFSESRHITLSADSLEWRQSHGVSKVRQTEAA